MTERKRFKFQSSSKIAKSIRLSAYDDIVSFISKDTDGSRRCFRINLTNLLRVKDLLKFQSDLRELQKSEFFSNNTLINKYEDTLVDNLQKPLQILLKCSRSASSTELDYLCRLLAAYFKDYGDSDLLKVPFDELLEIIEQNSNLNSKPIFTFVLTYFRSHTSYILNNIHRMLNEFMPWLNSRNPLIKRLSMECLGMLLRRAPIAIIKEVITLCIYTQGAEKIIFTIIHNVDGNFTTKIESLFTFMFEDLIPNKMEEVYKIVNNIRSTIQIMSTHTKDNKVDLSWLKSKYEDNINKLKENKCKIEFSALCIILELNLEMLLTFEQNKLTSVKNYPLITKGEYFKAILINFIIPLLKYSKESGKGSIFEELCSYLLRAVRSETEATEVLEKDFGLFLENIDHNIVSMNNINSFLSLFEWRLKTNDLKQISQILLIFSSIIDNRDIFHPLIVNKNILDRVLIFVNNTLSDMESTMEKESFLNLFSIMYGLSSINKVRIKLKASRIEKEDELLERVLLQVLRGLEKGYDSRLLIKTYTITYELLSKRDQVWIERLISASTRLKLFHNYFLVEFLVLNYNEKFEYTVAQVLDKLPNENEMLRVNAIKLVQLYCSKKGIEISWLGTLMEMERTPNDVKNARKKCMTMSRVVSSIDFDGLNKEYKIVVDLVKKVLLSQYFVKFAPLWEGSFSANTSLILKLKAHEKGLNETWELYYSQLKGLSLSEGWDLASESIESALKYKNSEKTDLVTIQFHLLRVISEIIGTVKDKDAKIGDLADYTLEQFKETRDFLKNAICTLSSVIVKFNRQVYKDELFDCCVTMGLKSADPKVRESSLNIISKRYKIDTKRLNEMCTGNYQQISSLTSTFEYGEVECESEEDRKNMDMSIGIEIRLLVPRIYQHSNVSHGNTIIDYFLNFESKYINLMLIELLPNEYSSILYYKEDDENRVGVVDGNAIEESYVSMYKTMKFDEAPYTLHLPNVLITLNLIIRRLLNHLKPQSIGIMEFCCKLLEKHRGLPTTDSNIVVERTLKIMIELVGIFTAGNFTETLVKYDEVIVEFSRIVGIDFVLACTSQVDHVEEFCTRVVKALFPGIFEVRLTQKHMTLADHIYNMYPIYLKKNEVSIPPEMMNLMVNSSERLLNSMCTHGNYNCHLISCIVELDLGDEVKLKALNIFLSSLPTRAGMTKLVNVKNEVDLWKKILGSLEKCLHLLDNNDVESINKIWDFIDNILSLVVENRCRKAASELLKKIQTDDEGVIYTGERLCSMNGVSVELRLDLDLNVEVITDVVQDLNTKRLSFRCINSLLTHSLFLLCNHHRDPGVRRSVAELSFKVMEITKDRLNSNSNEAYLNVLKLDSGISNVGSITFEIDPTHVMSITLFPFIRRSLAGSADDSLVCLCLEILEQFVRVFSDTPDPCTVFASVHPDLLVNPSVADCFHKMRELQKYKRCKGMKQLQVMVESSVFTNTTLLKLIIPTSLQFVIQSNAVRHVGLSDMSKQCLIASCKILPVPSFIRILKKIIQTYSVCKLPILLSLFSSITSAKMDSLTEYNKAEEEGFKDQLGVGFILSRLKKMSLVPGKHKLGDVPVVEVFECLGNLLKFYPEYIVKRELVKQCRILTKYLLSRNRDVRRLARISLINMAKPFKTQYIDVFVKELFTNMTKGYKCSVLIFTIYAILNKVLDDKNILSSKNQIKYLYRMILDEITRIQEKDDSSSKIDEARHPKSSQLMSLISHYSESKVVENNYEFLIALLNGKLMSNLEYSDKFLRKVNELIVSATSGLILNKNVDHLKICFKIFMSALPKVRGIEKNMDQFPIQVVELYRRCSQMGECKLKETTEVAKPADEENHNMSENSIQTQVNTHTPYIAQSHHSKLNDRLTVMPGASTGRSFESSMKKPGFENHIFSPLFVNSCLRLFNNTVLNMNIEEYTKNSTEEEPDGTFLHESKNKNSLDMELDKELVDKRVGYMLCEFSVLISFLSEEVILQKSSCTCLLKLCKCRPELIEDFGHVLALNLVDRMGSLDLVGSEELARDHLGLISIFFKSKYLDILYEAWDISNRKGKFVESLLLQIETNLNRPKLHTPLFKLLLILMKSTINTNTYTVKSPNILESMANTGKNASDIILNGCKHDDGILNTSSKKGKEESLSVYFDKEFYQVTYEIMIRMLKGNVSTKSATIVSKVVGYSFILLPMDENTRSKRFSLLLKHVNSSDPQVRLMTFKTLLVITRELPAHIVWKRYSSLLILALLPKLVSEENPNCRRFLQLLVTHIWSTGNKDNKNELLNVVAHFVKKMEKHVQLAFSFFVYLSLKKEESVHNINKLNLKVLTSFLEQINDDHWQNCYYWLMLLEHLLSIQFDITKRPASRVWEFVLDVGLGSQHPWILASSLRILSRVLCMKRINELIPNLSTRLFMLLKSTFRNLSTYYGYLERHRKLATATQDVFINSINVLSEHKDKSLERLASRICYILRCDLGRKSECNQRIDIILELLSHLASKEVVYKPRHRVMLLKVIIALFRVAHIKPAGVSHKIRKFKDSGTSHSDKASSILDRIENAFNETPAEYLKLFSFARNYVLKSRLVKKKQIALSMVTNTKMATLRKLKKNRKKRKRFSR